MFALRRVAVRALQYQPTRQLSTIRPVSLTSRIESSKPSLYRSFHQSRQWLAEEQKTTESPAEAEGGETVTVEPSAEEQKEIKEESIATPEVADAAPTSAVPESISQATEQVKSAAQSATDALSGVAGRVSDAVSGRPARSSFPNNDSASTKILYVGNLFFEVTAAELEAEFGRFGEIVNSRVVTDPKGQSKGFGYLEFSSAEAAQNAIRELDQKVFQGRRMAVQQHVRREQQPRGGYSRDGAQGRGFKRENPPSKTLFIGNMSYQMSDRDLNGEYSLMSKSLA